MLRQVVHLIVGFALLAGSTQAAIIYGTCELEGKTNYGLTKVEIDDSAFHAPVDTDRDGYYYWLAVAPGWHTFSYSHPGYHSQTHREYVPLFGGELQRVTLKTKAMCDPESWQHYPHQPDGTEITFPRDEGKHDPTRKYRVEWWYCNFHLIDEDNVPYGGFVAFFKPPMQRPGMVLFSVIELNQGRMWSDAKYPLLCDMSDQYFDLAFGTLLRDVWRNRECDGELLPFEYQLSVRWLDGGVVWLELDMAALKPPLPVGGDGLVEFGDTDWSYYYSHPRVDLQGRLHLPGFPALGKEVEGYGWIDHQWANFPSEYVAWEWIAIQLEDGRDIVVANVWLEDRHKEQFSGGLNLDDEHCELDVLHGYAMAPLRFYTDPETGYRYAVEWKITEPTRQIDINVEADFDHQIMEATGDIIQARFWEGACTATGTIEGEPVNGTAYAEVTHIHWGHCTGAEAISKTKCKKQHGRNKLAVKLVNGVVDDSFTVQLSTGQSDTGNIKPNGRGSVKLKNVSSGAGTATATWGCGAANNKEYDCP